METPQKRFKDLVFKIIHAERQRQNTWNIEERNKFNNDIKVLYIEIDNILDDYTKAKKYFQSDLTND